MPPLWPGRNGSRLVGSLSLLHIPHLSATDSPCFSRTVELPVHRPLRAKDGWGKPGQLVSLLPSSKGKEVATKSWMGKGARQTESIATTVHPESNCLGFTGRLNSFLILLVSLSYCLLCQGTSSVTRTDVIIFSTNLLNPM